MPSYALADHVFCCLHQMDVVIIDTRLNEYFEMKAVPALIGGWPRPLYESGDPKATEAFLAQLRARGWLVETAYDGPQCATAEISKPSEELDIGSLRTRPGLGATLAFIQAISLARLRLKAMPFHIVISRLQRRTASNRAASVSDHEKCRKYVAQFEYLRPFFSKAKDRCLEDSLALLEFLARYRIYPNLVFGVRTRPFAAHAWLQQGEYLLNDALEHVLDYTPIVKV